MIVLILTAVVGYLAVIQFGTRFELAQARYMFPVLPAVAAPPDVVVDQHFLRRQRQNRLLSVVLENPSVLGIGVDEETAIWVRPDGTLQVLGESGVMVFDAKGAAISRQPRPTGQDLLGVRSLSLHLLLPGDTFDLSSRRPL